MTLALSRGAALAALLPLAAASAETNRAAATATDEIVVRGELFCSVERRLPLPYGGVITRIETTVGRAVKAGDPLLRYRLPRRAAAELGASLSPAAAAAAEAELAATEIERDQARQALADLEELARESLATDRKLGEARALVAQIERRRTAVQARLEAERTRLDEQRKLIRELLGVDTADGRVPDAVVLTAPIDATVLWLAADAVEGAELPAGAPVAQVGVMDPMIVRAQTHEREIVRMAPGDRAKVTLLSLPDRVFEGTLRSIAWAPVPHALPEPSFYEIELSVPNADRVLRKGYKADLAFPAKP